LDEQPPFRKLPYDPGPAREAVRGAIALALIVILAIIVILPLVLLWIHPERANDIHDLLSFLFTPVVALVGSATGFYFGSQLRTNES
jgi:hypothetical protein